MSFTSRKDQRKQARLEKKQRKAAHFQKKGVALKKNGPFGKTELQPEKIFPGVSGNRQTPGHGRKRSVVPSKRGAPSQPRLDEVLTEDDEEICSDDLASCPSSDDREVSEEESEQEQNVGSTRYNKYGTPDPILAIAEEALDNGLFDSEGNIDSDGFEGLFGSKFDEQSDDGSEDDSVAPSGMDDAEEEDAEYEEDELTEGVSEASESTVAEIIEAKEKATMAVSADYEERMLLLQKKIKGLLNRLSMANFESIAVGLADLFREYPRGDMTQSLTELILGAITSDQANLLESFVLVFAALVATLAHLVGLDFTAHLLQRLVDVLDKERSERTVINLVTFLAFLYDLQIVGPQLIGELVHESVQRLDELDTEIILRLVRNCGAQFRRDDPSMLKKIILALNERVALVPAERQGSRFKFMLESIFDLKNNKMRAAAPQSAMESTKKLLRNMAQQRGIAKFEALRVGLEDLRQAETRGRWWLVGGTWAPQNEAKKETKASPNENNSIEALAKAQRMNTEVRKRIFAAICSSEDVLDAFQRLLALRLTSKQERDIPVVILHCVAQEKSYNPFYAVLAERCISFRHNHLITFKYACWDWLQQIEEAPIRKLSHLATFYATLVGKSCLPLGLLKKAEWLHLSDKQALFFQIFFCRLLLDSSEEQLTAAFEGLSRMTNRKKVHDDEDEDEQTQKQDTSGEIQVLKSSLKLFLRFYLVEKPSTDLPPFVKDRTKLLARIELVSVYLQ